jgi:hypothetical protein
VGGRCSPTSRVKALDEFLDFPHLDVLFRLILTHFFYSTNTRPVETFVSKRESRGLLFEERQMSIFFIQLWGRPGYTRYLHRLTRQQTVPRQARTRPEPTEMEPGAGPIRTWRTPKHRLNKLVPPRPLPTVPAGVSATGPRSAHHEGKNYITVTRKTKLGSYLRRCKDVILKNGCVLSESEARNARRQTDILPDTSPFISVLSARPFRTSASWSNPCLRSSRSPQRKLDERF